MPSVPPGLPRALIFLTAVTCALVATLALQVLLARRGLEIAGVWRDLSDGRPLRLAAASVWWVLAGSAFVIGAAVTAALGHFAPPWRNLRALRWILGALVVAALAYAAHEAEPPDGVPADIQVLAAGVILILTTIMAMAGSYFALRR